MTLRRMPLLLALPLAPGVIKLLDAVEQNQLLVHGGGFEGLIRQFLSISFLDNILPASLATILVLSCMWIPTLIIFLRFGSWCVRTLLLGFESRVRRAPVVEFIILVCVAELFLLTRFRTFTNVRYYLPVFPWLLLVAARAMLELRWSRRIRLLVQAVTLLAFGVSNFRSFDPISARVFGSIPFGEHRLFHVTSLTRECCGLGRDQLVYNLEFAQIDRILRDVLPHVLTARGHVIAIHPQANWFVFRSIDAISMQRSTPESTSMRLPYVSIGVIELTNTRPEKIHYIALPNMPNSDDLARYKRMYSVASTRRFRQGGYYIDVFELVRKP